MNDLSGNSKQAADEHACESYRDGDWIVFLCPQCETYERRLNWRTGDMKVRDNTETHVRHSGEYFPDEMGYAFTCPN
ncbi:MAG: hypothetical protein AB8G77_18745 [Rhodothermales bacterium]